mgnify:CR=1 FL=1
MKRIILLVLFSLLSLNFGSVPQSNFNHSNMECVDTSFLSQELNDSILYLALVHYEIKEPKIVLAQAKLESANYTSSIFKRKNNFLGLYNSKKRQYFEFDHWSECILAYKKMIEYKHKDGEDYYHFLHRIGYAEDPAYLDKVRKIEQDLNV